MYKMVLKHPFLFKFLTIHSLILLLVAYKSGTSFSMSEICQHGSFAGEVNFLKISSTLIDSQEGTTEL